MKSFEEAPANVVNDGQSPLIRRESEGENVQEGSSLFASNETREHIKQEADEDHSEDLQTMSDQNSIQGSQSVAYVDEVTESQPLDGLSLSLMDSIEGISASDHNADLADRKTMESFDSAEAHQSGQRFRSPSQVDGDLNFGDYVHEYHHLSQTDQVDEHIPEASSPIERMETREEVDHVEVEEKSLASHSQGFENMATQQDQRSPSPDVKLEPLSPPSSIKSSRQADLSFGLTTGWPSSEKSGEALIKSTSAPHNSSYSEPKDRNMEPTVKIETENDDQFHDASSTFSTASDNKDKVALRAQEVNTHDDSEPQDKTAESSHNKDLADGVGIMEGETSIHQRGTLPEEYSMVNVEPSNTNHILHGVTGSPKCVMSDETNPEVMEVVAPIKAPLKLLISDFEAGSTCNPYGQKMNNGYSDTPTFRTEHDTGFEGDISPLSPGTNVAESPMKSIFGPVSPPPAKSREDSFFDMLSLRGVTTAFSPNILPHSENNAEVRCEPIESVTETPLPANEQDHDKEGPVKKLTSQNSSLVTGSSKLSSHVVNLDSEEEVDKKDQLSPLKTINGKHEDTKSKTIKSAKHDNDESHENDSQDSENRTPDEMPGRGRSKNADGVAEKLANSKTNSKKQPANKNVKDQQAAPKTTFKTSKSKKDVATIEIDCDAETPKSRRSSKRKANTLELEAGSRPSTKRHNSNPPENDDDHAYEDGSVNKSRGIQRSHQSPEVVAYSPGSIESLGPIDLTGANDDGASDREDEQSFSSIMEAPLKTTRQKPAAITSKKRPTEATADKKPPAKKAKVEQTKATSGKKTAPGSHDHGDQFTSTNKTQHKSATELRPMADPIGKFPRLNNGDVYISLSVEDKYISYILESETLCRLSSFFRRELEVQVLECDPELRSSVSYQARFSLKFRRGTSEVHLGRTSFTVRSKPNPAPFDEKSTVHDQRLNEYRTSDAASVNSMRSTPAPEPLIQQAARNNAENLKNKKMTNVFAQAETNIKDRFIEKCDNLFRAYYNMPLKIDQKNLERALGQAEDLLDLATEYESLPGVQECLPKYIFHFSRELYNTIASDPPRWLKLSLRLRCAPIFKEAILHIVGNYPKWRDASIEASTAFPDASIYIDWKIKQFRVTKNKIDQYLLRDNHWCADEEQLTLFNAQETSFNTLLVNMAWKDWFGLSLKAADKIRAKKHEDASMYREISQGAEFFMDPEFIRDRLQSIRNTEFTEKEVDDLYKDLAKLKEYAQEMVRPLCVNVSATSGDAYFTHFLCVDVPDEELPWAGRP